MVSGECAKMCVHLALVLGVACVVYALMLTSKRVGVTLGGVLWAGVRCWCTYLGVCVCVCVSSERFAHAR